MASVGASFLQPSRPLEVNPPLSSEPSRPEDASASATLIAYLDEVDPLADDESLQLRETLLNELLNLFRVWVRTVGVAKGILDSDDDCGSEATPGGTMFVSGSYKLGVASASSDIDCILVAPRFVHRDDFFATLPPLLREQPGVSEILSIAEAKVPIIELVYRGVAIDLLFASLPLTSVPATLNILDDSLLQGLDEASIITLNGPRVTELIFRSVPDPGTFKVVLRALRYWAKVSPALCDRWCGEAAMRCEPFVYSLLAHCRHVICPGSWYLLKQNGLSWWR